MTAAKLKANKIVITSAILLAAILLGLFWLKKAYKSTQAIQTAQQFLAHLQAKQFDKANLLTVQSGLVGKTAVALEAISKQQLCSEKPLRFAWVAPLQSNGNRLRRWLNGREIDMPEVIVELESHGCLMSFTLRPTNDDWKIASFQSHAG